MKLATKTFAGSIVDLERRADLLDDPVMHGDDAVGHGHRLDLVVRHVDGRRAELAVQLLDLAAHLLAEPRIEIGERLVEEEGLRLADDGAAHGDALPLAAGERPRPSFEQAFQPKRAGGDRRTASATRSFGVRLSLRL